MKCVAFTLQAFNATEELKEAKKFHNIRVFTVQTRFSPIPLPDLLAVLEKWSVPSNGTDFSLSHSLAVSLNCPEMNGESNSNQQPPVPPPPPKKKCCVCVLNEGWLLTRGLFSLS